MSKVRRLWRFLNAPIQIGIAPNALITRQAQILLRRHELESCRTHARKRDLLREMHRSAASHDATNFSKSSKQLTHVLKELQLLERMLAVEPVTANIYVFSSWMLRDSFFYCTAAPEEAMHFILGFEQDGVAIGTNMVSFNYSERSIVGARGNHQDTHRICIEAHESGHRILALIHSHPGSGINANRKSATDEANQRLWELTTRMIGGIWSRDGYLRWYSSELAYEIRIIGNHMKRIHDHVWKLEIDEESAASTAIQRFEM